MEKHRRYLDFTVIAVALAGIAVPSVRLGSAFAEPPASSTVPGTVDAAEARPADAADGAVQADGTGAASGAARAVETAEELADGEPGPVADANPHLAGDPTERFDVADQLDLAEGFRLFKQAPVRLIRDLEYARPGGEPLTADLYLPASPTASAPVIVMVHGGAWAVGNKDQMYWHARSAAARGMAALSINYRLAPSHRHPAQLEDLRAAVRWLAAQGGRYGLDVSRLALFGYSAGGHLACLFALEASQQATREAPVPLAVVAGGAPCEFSWIPDHSRVLAYWLGGSQHELPEVYRQASPLYHVSKDDPPVFLFHGQRDRLVPLQSPQRLLARLTEAGVLAQLYVVPDKGHLLTFIDQEAWQQALEFLEDRLQRLPLDDPPSP